MNKKVFKHIFIKLIVVLDIILTTLAVLAIVEGLFLIAFPAKTKSMVKYFAKKSTNIRKLGILEFVIGIVLLIIGVSFRLS